jgi:hypothetical protein
VSPLVIEDVADEVEDPLETAVVSLRAPQVAADLPGVARHRSDTGEAGETVGGAESAHVAAGGC